MANEPKFGLKAINQVGLVVRDLDKTMEAYWRNFGVGPWRVYTYGPEMSGEMTYRDGPGAFRMRVAVADVGGVHIELIQHLEGDSLYKEHMERFGEGLHHLAVRVDNLDRAMEEMREAGFRVIQSGRGHGVHGDGGWAYVDSAEELGTIWELIEVPSERKPAERYYP